MNYKYYGARGIYTCKEWVDDFWAYFDWCCSNYEVGKTVDRVDNDGPYSPDNCRFSSALDQQQNNRRVTPARTKAINRACLVKMYRDHAIFGDPRVRDKKICYACLEEKPLYEFNKNKATLDNRQTHCRKCQAHDRKKRELSRNNRQAF